ncbi:MAG: hypothetical protein ACRCXT_17705 [Paraclostridium sp.]
MKKNSITIEQVKQLLLEKEITSIYSGKLKGCACGCAGDYLKLSANLNKNLLEKINKKGIIRAYFGDDLFGEYKTLEIVMRENDYDIPYGYFIDFQKEQND